MAVAAAAGGGGRSIEYHRMTTYVPRAVPIPPRILRKPAVHCRSREFCGRHIAVGRTVRAIGYHADHVPLSPPYTPTASHPSASHFTIQIPILPSGDIAFFLLHRHVIVFDIVSHMRPIIGRNARDRASVDRMIAMIVRAAPEPTVVARETSSPIVVFLFVDPPV